MFVSVRIVHTMLMTTAIANLILTRNVIAIQEKITTMCFCISITVTAISYALFTSPLKNASTIPKEFKQVAPFPKIFDYRRR